MTSAIEVRELGVASLMRGGVADDHDVAGLHVPVHETCFRQLLQPSRRLHEQLPPRFEGDVGPILLRYHEVVQAAICRLHDDEALEFAAVSRHAHGTIEGDDVPAAKALQRLDLAVEEAAVRLCVDVARLYDDVGARARDDAPVGVARGTRADKFRLGDHFEQLLRPIAELFRPQKLDGAGRLRLRAEKEAGAPQRPAFADADAVRIARQGARGKSAPRQRRRVRLRNTGQHRRQGQRRPAQRQRLALGRPALRPLLQKRLGSLHAGVALDAPPFRAYGGQPKRKRQRTPHLGADEGG
mmetsp:Transcript_118722/g.332492  ORF Transcript_118722/g.332492 Transcript_118722/m.332492 type:complete len:298 (+) Transcript_118722:514-1407(+)